jgi:hypothetical protein
MLNVVDAVLLGTPGVCALLVNPKGSIEKAVR